jgi:hypothetical protein
MQGTLSRTGARRIENNPYSIEKEWSWRRGLNPRPSDYKSDALPTELRQHPFHATRCAEESASLPPLQGVAVAQQRRQLADQVDGGLHPRKRGAGIPGDIASR